jgi:hypothetical protein
MPYWVPWPPGAVTAAPAPHRSGHGVALTLDRRQPVPVAEHVQLGGDAVAQRIALGVAPTVSVAVDQPRQQGLAAAVDGSDARRHIDLGTDRADATVDHQHLRVLAYARAVEHAHIADQYVVAGVAVVAGGLRLAGEETGSRDRDSDREPGGRAQFAEEEHGTTPSGDRTVEQQDGAGQPM